MVRSLTVVFALALATQALAIHTNEKLIRKESASALAETSSQLSVNHDGSVASPMKEYALKEKKVYSQNGEDGIIQSICDIVGCNLKNYVEFGAEDCTECNSRQLREKGWKGLVMDGSHENLSINLRTEMITVENIVDLFQKYDVQKELDVLSVDVDGMDFYVLRHIMCSGAYNPKIIVVEYNSHIPTTAGALITPLTKPPSRCIGYCNGMSLGAVKALGSKFGYKLIHSMSVGVNAFLVREDALPKDFVVPELAQLDRPSTYSAKGPDAWRKAQPHWDDIEKDKTYLLSTCDDPHYVDHL